MKVQNEPTSLQVIVASAGRRLKFSSLLSGAAWWLATCLGLWLVLFVFDNLLNLPAGLRLPLALAGFVFSAVVFFRRVFVPLTQTQTPERTALMLENRYDIGENLLINAVQFEHQKLRPEERPFAERTVALSENRLTRIHLKDLWDWPKLARWGGGAAAVVLLWLAYIALFPHHFSSATARFVLPLGDVPPPGDLVLKLEPNSDVTVAEGDSLEITLSTDAKQAAALKKLPVVVWRDKATFIEPLQSDGDQALMGAKAGQPGTFVYVFANIQFPLAFRVFAGESYTRCIRVSVRPLPKIQEARFLITPPAYTGLKPTNHPGPPASVSLLPGSKLDVALTVAPAIKAAYWQVVGQTIELNRTGGRWDGTTLVSTGGTYEIKTAYSGGEKATPIAQGSIRLLVDNPPEIDFVTEDRNRLVQLGNKVKLEIQARDDFGIRHIDVTARPVEQEQSIIGLKRWTYLGPPGNPGPFKETCTLEIDPAIFKMDNTYLVEALAGDFCPTGQPGKSRPILLRVKSQEELTLPSDDPLAGAFAKLKQTIARQEKANQLTSNLKTYLEEALQKKTIPARQKAMSSQQQEAKNVGQQAVAEFNKVPEGKMFAVPLESLVEGEMNLVLGDLGRLSGSKTNDLPTRLAALEKRQNYILTELMTLLGQVAERRQSQSKLAADPKEEARPPTVTPTEAAKDLVDDLEKFTLAEQRILERTKSLLDQGPQDLTEKEEAILGDLAREQAEWSKFFEDKLTDFSKLPLQDFADGSLAKELNEVFQEIKLAEKSLYEKKVELAVPHEQSGLENAKELLHNLERWLPDTPDHLKWNMEEPLNPADVALAELPSELEDIVGDLLDKEEEMTQDVEDVTSPWMDSADKGAGWDAMDGPISNMSAKGVTGNLLPNQQEIGGRAGEGRSGRSQGQIVEETAEGKGGRETPTRVSPSPFEQGSVQDSSKESKGGATGGGKLAGFGAEGLRGPVPPATREKMPRLAERQTKIRQQAEALALRLRQYRLPTGDLETSINAMQRMEDAARKIDGLGVRRAFSRAVDALEETKAMVRAEKGLHHEQNKLPGWMRDEIRIGVQDGIPRGYEEMASEYFRALAESGNK